MPFLQNSCEAGGNVGVMLLSPGLEHCFEEVWRLPVASGGAQKQPCFQHVSWDVLCDEPCVVGGALSAMEGDGAYEWEIHALGVEANMRK